MNATVGTSVYGTLMKIALLLVSLLFAPLVQAGDGWSEDYLGTMKQAKQAKKPLLLEFTGTKWCPPCIAFGKNVLSTEEFKNYAKEHFALARVDFPDPLDFPEDKVELAKKYVAGDELRLPTVVVFDGAGKKLGQLNYSSGNAAKFIGELQKIAGK